MGGSEATEWLGALDASFEAALAREEEVAATDLAFSLRQDVDVRAAIARSGTGWALVGADGASSPVEESGADYLRAGGLVVPARRATVRSVSGPSPRRSDRTFLELLGAACRAGVNATVTGSATRVSGRLVRVAKDHVAVQRGTQETVVGLEAVESVRLADYSTSRGLSGSS